MQDIRGHSSSFSQGTGAGAALVPAPAGPARGHTGSPPAVFLPTDSDANSTPLRGGLRALTPKHTPLPATGQRPAGGAGGKQGRIDEWEIVRELRTETAAVRRQIELGAAALAGTPCTAAPLQHSRSEGSAGKEDSQDQLRASQAPGPIPASGRDRAFMPFGAQAKRSRINIGRPSRIPPAAGAGGSTCPSKAGGVAAVTILTSTMAERYVRAVGIAPSTIHGAREPEPGRAGTGGGAVQGVHIPPPPVASWSVQSELRAMRREAGGTAPAPLAHQHPAGGRGGDAGPGRSSAHSASVDTSGTVVLPWDKPAGRGAEGVGGHRRKATPPAAGTCVPASPWPPAAAASHPAVLAPQAPSRKVAGPVWSKWPLLLLAATDCS